MNHAERFLVAVVVAVAAIAAIAAGAADGLTPQIRVSPTMQVSDSAVHLSPPQS